MNLSLKGQRAIVKAAVSGVGRVVAETFAANCVSPRPGGTAA